MSSTRKTPENPWFSSLAAAAAAMAAVAAMAAEAAEVAAAAMAAEAVEAVEAAVRFGGAAVASEPANHVCFFNAADVASWSGPRMTAERLVRPYREMLGKGDHDCRDEVEA
jgi:hypothetical protein